MVLPGVVINNFLWRNISLLCIVASPVIMQAIALGSFQNGDIIYQGITTLFLYLAILFHNMVLYERVFLKKQYIPYAIATVLTVYLMHKLLIATSAVIYREIPEHVAGKWLSLFWADLVYIYAGLAIYMAYRHFRQKEEAQNIELLGKKLELKQLKEQLQPHFLFNALNNIYSYGLQGDSKGNELILKLSEQMRYIISQSSVEMTSIEEEALFIENYIDFEKERLGRRCEISFAKKVTDGSKKIPPLIFFPFIENAFKHGTNTLRTSHVDLELTTAESEIFFCIKNSIFSVQGQASTQVGLTNAKRRLELLYPGRHHLEISDGDGQYKVSLKLHA